MITIRGIFNKFTKLALAFILVLSLFSLFINGAYVQAHADEIEMRNGYGTLTANIDNATSIGFAGKVWSVIGFSDTLDTASTISDIQAPGTTSTTSQTATLILASGQTDLIHSIFGIDNTYSTSELRASMDTAASTVSSLESSLIVTRTLPGGAAGQDPDLIAGGTVTGAQYWPLSVTEAKQIDNSILDFNSLPWWLRSSGNLDVTAPMVYYGGIDEGDIDVTDSLYLRPAFKLDLTKVLLTSASTGGKVTKILGTLEPTVQPKGSIKLTVTDSSLILNSAVETSRSADSITFDYTVTGSANSLSAVVQSSSGEIKFYGSLVSDPGTSGSATVTVPGSLVEGDKLLVFVEQINEDNFTDFASHPLEISSPEPLTPTSDTSGTLAATGDSTLLLGVAAIAFITSAGVLIVRRRVTSK